MSLLDWGCVTRNKGLVMAPQTGRGLMMLSPGGRDWGNKSQGRGSQINAALSLIRRRNYCDEGVMARRG